MSQRVFVCFLVKFLTKCHSFSVSIETSEPFSCLRHSSWAALQLIVSSWKVYLEQTVTNVYGEPTDKREKRQTRQNDLFTYLSIAEIKIGYTEGELNEKLRHKKVSTSAMVQWGLGKWNCEFARLGHYISQKTFEGWHPPSLPLQSHVQRYKGELELCFCIITTNTNKLGVFYKIVYVAIFLFLRHNINARLISLPDRQIFRYKDVWICKWDSTSRKNANLIEYKHRMQKEIWWK